MKEGGEGQGRSRAYQSCQWPNDGERRVLPPSCIAEPPGIHLPHVPKANQSDDKVFHVGGRDGGNMLLCEGKRKLGGSSKKVEEGQKHRPYTAER